jgi:hypothetical protein
MRDLVISKLLANAAANRAEWGGTLWEDKSFPRDDKGYIEYSKVTIDHLTPLSDEVLLALLDDDACLKYR